jgi:pyruvate formate lyase activating enzyme
MLDRPPTPPHTLKRARSIALKNGLRYVFTGNIRDPEGQATRCHQCGAVVIGRDGYDITTWRLRGGCCRSCGARCAGVFEDEPGQWGSRRMPVKL